MNNNQSNIWRAMCELGDYFSRLGGASRPHNMAESEIQLYVACKLIEFNENTFNSKEYLDNDFLEAASPVIKKTDSLIREVSLSSIELILFTLEFYEYADKKLNEIEKTRRWKTFGDYLRRRNA